VTYWFRFSGDTVWPMVSKAFQHCRFYREGGCTRGRACAFYHAPGLGGTAKPDASAGATAKPDASAGATAKPDVGTGATAKPDVGTGATAKPDASATAKPDVSATAKPDVGTGATAKPDVGTGATAQPDVSATAKPDAGTGATPRACRFWNGASRSCARGDACRFAHAARETALKGLCRFYDGRDDISCRFGARCAYVHDAARAIERVQRALRDEEREGGLAK
jgi:hypothetical protein